MANDIIKLSKSDLDPQVSKDNLKISGRDFGSWRANRKNAGTKCPFCQSTIQFGKYVTECEKCKTLYHIQCWDDNHGCGTYGCENTSSKSDTPVSESVENQEVVIPPPPNSNLGMWLFIAAGLAFFFIFFIFFIISLVSN